MVATSNLVKPVCFFHCYSILTFKTIFLKVRAYKKIIEIFIVSKLSVYLIIKCAETFSISELLENIDNLKFYK